ncbi:MAG: hypothetical protein M3680_21665 [Myxococcota bacterium]|nr:hypothetical protein [Myxococcota bacterium]
MKSILLLTILASSLSLAACKNEPTKDADPCAKATENARRLVSNEPGAFERYGAEPLPVERCRTLTSREEISCLGYASSLSELTACSPGAIRPAADVARQP